MPCESLTVSQVNTKTTRMTCRDVDKDHDTNLNKER